MLLHEITYIYEVYRQGSFTRDAQVLYISQPSLSQMVRKAERRIGAPIFDRSISPIALTEAGRAYIRAAEQLQQCQCGKYHGHGRRSEFQGLTPGYKFIFNFFHLLLSFA